ncbi:MAG TPA: hypothetical protein VKB14_14260 [Actinomycetales bacterium]|nr:hypothetical protein [Actinomycetales bacterium]
MPPLDPSELTGEERLLHGQGRTLADLAVRRQAVAHTQRVADLVACAVAGMQSGLDVRSVCERLAHEPDPVLGVSVGWDGLLDVLTPLLVGAWGRRRLSPDEFADAVIADAATARLSSGTGPLAESDAATIRRASELGAAVVRYAAVLAGRVGFSPADAAALGCTDDDPRLLVLADELATQCAPTEAADQMATAAVQAWPDDGEEDVVDLVVAGVLLICWAQSNAD